jgi:HEAT repeat protein
MAGRAGRTIFFTGLLIIAAAAVDAVPTAAGQAIHDLTNRDAKVRLRAASSLGDAAPPEAMIPLAQAILDTDDAVQVAAITAELNLFLADKGTLQRAARVENRSKIAAENIFLAGPLAIGPRNVPTEVLAAVLAATGDENLRVGLEALYALGALSVQPCGEARRGLLRATGPRLAALTVTLEPSVRLAALRVIGRLFARRPQDRPVDQDVADAVIIALNDQDKAIKMAAMNALGAMAYERAVDPLSELFRYYERGELAEAALDALARIAQPTSASLLMAQLDAKADRMKMIAIEGLARSGDRTRLAAIQAALRGDVSESAQLAGTFAGVMLSDMPVDRIVDSLFRASLREQGKQYLIDIARNRADVFGRYVPEFDARVKADVADILGLAADPAARPIVEPLTKDSNPLVVLAAERAIARLQ